ncbi:hypothetical protein JQ628_15030 [Bradyrhizobium lablabi]|uniref:hypothetical protein n=1 Tax=Bradyrhizobium lablabi TaxID=722472 RepID=UPI001BA83B31|nr:hypothetical protein [Bradyrhizobium lablabi]MBR1122839.1 hypothetical protein [Bradyrhizobium lablabi]
MEAKACRYRPCEARKAPNSPAVKKGRIGEDKTNPAGGCANQYLHAAIVRQDA